MARKHISRDDMVSFLKEHEPKLYEKYKDYTAKDWTEMNSGDKKPFIAVLSKYALYQGYRHGDVLEFIDAGLRQRNLMFWDAMKGKAVSPTYAHGEASLPEQFLVGDGLFDPYHWAMSLNDYVVRPCKSLVKDIKTHFAKQTTPLEITLNRHKYTVILEEDSEWDGFQWDKLMLYPIEKDTLQVSRSTKADERAPNENKLRAFLKGDPIKDTRKRDVEDKLVLAEKRLAEAMQEVARLRLELKAFGKKTRRV